MATNGSIGGRPAPLPPNEPGRMAALHALQLLDTHPNDRIDRIARLAARIFNCPIALVSLVDTDRQWFKACIGLDSQETPRSISFCAHAILDEGPLVIPDATQDVRFADNPLVVGEPGIRFYAGQPIAAPGGERIGTLCVIDQTPRSITDDELGVLAELAELVEFELDGVALRQAVECHREAERRLRAVMRGALDCIVTVNHEWRIVEINPATEQAFGYSQGEAVGRPLASLVPLRDGSRGDGARLHPERDRYELAGALDQRIEAEGIHASGRRFPVELAIVGVEGARPPMFTAFLRDVTDRRAREDELRRAKESAQRASDAKSEFLSHLSHEMRTPLNSIMGFAQLLEGADLEPDDRDCLDHIASAGKHLLELISDVLDISRIEAGKLPLSVDPVAPLEVIEESLNLVHPLGLERGISFQHEVGVTESTYILTDRQRLRQILINLLTNAVIHSGGGGQVVMRCTETADRVRLAVRDDGPGIPAESQARLFRPFERLETSAGTEGAGLGLALTKGLVEAMGGTVGVISEPGNGSEFWVELPRAGHRPEDREIDPPADVAVVTTPQRKRILYIEDNAANRTLVERIVARRGDIELDTRCNGRDGLAAARDLVPDLILLDLNLPDLDGAEVLTALREDERCRSVPVVFISADATSASIQKMLAAGARAYLTKPLNVDGFLEVLDGALGGPDRAAASSPGTARA